MTQPSLCDQCGAPLNPGAKFCSKCGQMVRALPEQPQSPAIATPAGPVSIPPPQATAAQEPVPVPRPAPAAPIAAPQPPQSGEQVLGVIPAAQRRKGLFGTQTFSVIVTPTRLVFAEVTSQMQKDAVREAQQEAKQQGKGFLGQIGAQLSWLNRIVDKYSAMPVERALAETQDNFFILNSHVRKVQIQHQHDMERHTSSDFLVIEAASGKHRFELKGGGIDQTRAVLRQTLGAAVK
jgi:zinc-ribbon domain